ncbi:tyrosine-tRNA ligase [Basidiobolus meristosporus CBS 931.73]|uniref:Tyrosine--tRNA ligase n=1 Tax=Basidiobolus meristosporus CBS 931.73 TaxID=1314790 RepID=A0A1Y1XB85_9FUNG|nr:tyrosine-tRNA ligase [Basidiobolus meristosporus CBS 931.73]|eukprot:ORX83008.1 tyrosine-tRNA ligase [Basidiobolus meristosporus CBS 931.73]
MTSRNTFTGLVRTLRPALNSLVRKYSTNVAASNNNVVAELQARGLIASLTSPKIFNHVDSPTTIYCGVDPTAKSLHVGNLCALMGLLHFQAKGHQSIALIGGATGAIGDPSGRSTERTALDDEVLWNNVAMIKAQLDNFFERGQQYIDRRGSAIRAADSIQPIKVLNNFDWFGKMTAIDFLTDVGRFARVGAMLARESVKARMDSSHGISFTEFSYQLLQANDFWHLYKHHNCSIQLGGSDQWGNITAGIDLIQKRHNYETQGSFTSTENDLGVYGITLPLLTTSTGEKFGKSAGNAVWLNENMTSLFDFYQFFMKTPDSEVKKLLNVFTFLTTQEIDEIDNEHQKSPEARLGQIKLANEVTELVHGVEGLKKAQTATRVLFQNDLKSVRADDIINAFSNDQRLKSLDASFITQSDVAQIAVASGACSSKSEATRLIKAGGMYINGERITDPKQKLQSADLMEEKLIVLRSGKSNYWFIRVQ